MGAKCRGSKMQRMLQKAKEISVEWLDTWNIV